VVSLKALNCKTFPPPTVLIEAANEAF